jgi:hypothetical protein
VLTTEITTESAPYYLEFTTVWWVICRGCSGRFGTGLGRDSEIDDTDRSAWKVDHSLRKCPHRDEAIETPEVAAARCASQALDAAAQAAGYRGANVYRGLCARCGGEVAARTGGWTRVKAGSAVQVFHLDTAICSATLAQREARLAEQQREANLAEQELATSRRAQAARARLGDLRRDQAALAAEIGATEKALAQQRQRLAELDAQVRAAAADERDPTEVRSGLLEPYSPDGEGDDRG